MRRKHRTYKLLLKWDDIMQRLCDEQEKVEKETGIITLCEKLETTSIIIEDLRVLHDKNYKRKLTKIFKKSTQASEKDGKCHYHNRYFCHNDMCIEHENNKRKKKK